MQKLAERIATTHERAERLNKIALKLLEQLKGEQINFDDAEYVIRRITGLLEQEKRQRIF